VREEVCVIPENIPKRATTAQSTIRLKCGFALTRPGLVVPAKYSRSPKFVA
jgi:hypothetical protein